MLTFDRALADLGAREFVEHVLVGALSVRIVMVGADFRCGRGGAGTPGCPVPRTGRGVRFRGRRRQRRPGRATAPAGVSRRHRCTSSSTPETSRCRRTPARPSRTPCAARCVCTDSSGPRTQFPRRTSPNLEGFVPAEACSPLAGQSRHASDGASTSSQQHAVPHGHQHRHEPHVRRHRRAWVEAYVLDKTT